MKFCRSIRYSFYPFFIIVACNIFVSTPVCSAQTSMPSAVNVRLVTDEAETVLVILNKRKANQPITEADWQKVFQSEGYVRLKKRETAMKYSFEDGDFKTFALSKQAGCYDIDWCFWRGFRHVGGSRQPRHASSRSEQS